LSLSFLLLLKFCVSSLISDHVLDIFVLRLRTRKRRLHLRRIHRCNEIGQVSCLSLITSGWTRWRRCRKSLLSATDFVSSNRRCFAHALIARTEGTPCRLDLCARRRGRFVGPAYAEDRGLLCSFCRGQVVRVDYLLRIYGKWK
ncbi:hypothetical protein BC830DRAFT_1114344, partial [Chytriomyces sp. MP71]